MVRQGLALVLVSLLAGCQAGATFNPRMGRTAAPTSEERTRLAAFAASAQYPQQVQAQDNLRAAATVNREDGTIRILNFSDRPLRDATVWVNGSFVQRLDVVPPNGSVILDRGQFYDATGRSLADQRTTATRIQLQWGEELYNLMGPIVE
jgi:hypothetical protein